MTHTLHRCGCIESLKDDYVLIAMVNKVNRDRARPLLSRVAEIMFEAGLNNTGSTLLATNLPSGLDRQQFIKGIAGANALLCAFDNKESLRRAVKKIKAEKLGISITVSGLIDEVEELARELDIQPHTINFSLGILGNTSRLADEETREVTSMCGHALISANLVKQGVQEVARGGDADKVAKDLATPCVCGIFNMTRAAQLLRQAAQQA